MCWAAMAAAPSWPCPRTTRATLSLRPRSACPCGASWRRPAPAARPTSARRPSCPSPVRGAPVGCLPRLLPAACLRRRMAVARARARGPRAQQGQARHCRAARLPADVSSWEKAARPTRWRVPCSAHWHGTGHAADGWAAVVSAVWARSLSRVAAVARRKGRRGSGCQLDRRGRRAAARRAGHGGGGGGGGGLAGGARRGRGQGQLQAARLALRAAALLGRALAHRVCGRLRRAPPAPLPCAQPPTWRARRPRGSSARARLAVRFGAGCASVCGACVAMTAEPACSLVVVTSPTQPDQAASACALTCHKTALSSLHRLLAIWQNRAQL